MQVDMFDKGIAELRALQIVNNATGQGINWSLEFRFIGEDKWYPVRLEVFGVDMEENNDEPSSPAATEDR